MKKIYVHPSTRAVDYSLSDMIAASGYGQPENGFNLNEVTTTEAVSGNLSRRSVWEDDEVGEEEF